jgi:hypothetical protein
MLQARQLVTACHHVLKTLFVVSVLVIVYVYLNFVLGLYPWSRPLAQQLFALFLHPLYTTGTAVLRALPNLVFLAILVMMTRYILKIVRFFFAGLDQGTITLANFDRDWAWPTYRIIRLLIIAFTLVVAYPYIPGSGSAAFKGVSLWYQRGNGSWHRRQTLHPLTVRQANSASRLTRCRRFATTRAPKTMPQEKRNDGERNVVMANDWTRHITGSADRRCDTLAWGLTTLRKHSWVSQHPRASASQRSDWKAGGIQPLAGAPDPG